MLDIPIIYFFWTLVSLALYWSIPGSESKSRQRILVLLSFLLIYSVSPLGALAAFAVGTLTALLSKWISLSGRRTSLWIAIILLCIPLAILRASFFFTSNWILIGIAFYTLKSIGTLVDCFNSRQFPGFDQVLLLTLFFPIFSAGPIERNSCFDMSTVRAPDLKVSVECFVRICVGYFKVSFLYGYLLKPMVKFHWPSIYASPELYSFSDLSIFVLFISAQHYVNFSGYSDIAIGTGRLFGFPISENFNSPFLCTNLQDFWKRWHISLANWSLRYLYFPLVTRWRKQGVWSLCLASLIVFVVLGLWHEFNLPYVLWGMMHGVGLATLRLLHHWGAENTYYLKLKEKRVYNLAARTLTLFYVAWSHVLVTAPDLHSVWKLGIHWFSLGGV